MKALSLHPCWAYEVAQQIKKEEYRSWSTSHRGDLVICATAAKSKNDLIYACGHALCVVDLCNVTQSKDGYTWHLRNVRYIDPVPVKGRQRLFDVDDQLLQEIANTDGHKLSFNDVISYWIDLGLIFADAAS